MSTESKDFDHYAIVLADLKSKRDQLDQAIAAIEAIRGGGSSSGSTPVKESPPSPSAAIETGAFLGLSIAEAVKKLLGIRKRQLTNSEILTEFKTGGFHMSSVDPINTIGAVLTRRFKETGDIVRVERGTWGLKEWYPNRTFSKTSKPTSDNDKPAASEVAPLSKPENSVPQN